MGKKTDKKEELQRDKQMKESLKTKPASLAKPQTVSNKEAVDVKKPATETTKTAYCVKCKAKREIVNPKKTTTKAGKPALTGTCKTCSGKVYKMGS